MPHHFVARFLLLNDWQIMCRNWLTRPIYSVISIIVTHMLGMIIRLTLRKKEYQIMKGLMEKFIERLVIALLPRVLDELVRVLEEIIQQDINGDGQIG